jgi:hypothetical protein
MFRRRRAWQSLPASTCIALCLIAIGAGRAFAEVDAPQSSGDQGLEEVTVTATRELDHRALSRAVTGYVESHTAPGTRINQIGRWHEKV